MPLELKDLDGTYRVTTVTDSRSPVKMESDGVTEIKDGKTNRVDDAGCEWNTHINILSDTEVEFVSVADPRNAREDFMLTLPSGELTKDPVTYRSTLAVAQKGDKIKLSGNIQHGDTVTIITMIKQ